MPGIMNPVFWNAQGSDQFTYRVRVTAGQTTSPKYTYVAGYPAAFIDWGDGEARTASVSATEYTHTYVVAGEYTVTLIMNNQAKWLSAVDINTDNVIQVVTPVQLFRALTSIILNTNAALMQNVQNWVINSNMTVLYLHLTGLYGSINGFVIPAGMTAFRVYSTSITGYPDLSQIVSIQQIRAENCALPEATVDAYLAGCWAREASTTFATPILNLGGTNAAPSAAGVINANNLIAAGWVVTTS